MNKGKTLRAAVPLAGAVCGLGWAGQAGAAMTFNGNSATGFGGTAGNGSVAVSDGGGNVTFTFNPSGAFTGNDLVLYIDSQAGGLPDTSTITDGSNGTDGGNIGASGENTGANPNNNGGNPSRTTVFFPAGFGADFALGFENNVYMALYKLNADGSLTYETGAAPANSFYSLSVPENTLGLTAGQNLSFVGTLIATSAYRSNETIGPSTTTVDPGNPGAAPNAGYNGTVTFSSAETYTTAAVPEPAGLTALALGGVALVRRRRAPSGR